MHTSHAAIAATLRSTCLPWPAPHKCAASSAASALLAALASFAAAPSVVAPRWFLVGRCVAAPCLLSASRRPKAASMSGPKAASMSRRTTVSTGRPRSSHNSAYGSAQQIEDVRQHPQHALLCWTLASEDGKCSSGLPGWGPECMCLARPCLPPSKYPHADSACQHLSTQLDSAPQTGPQTDSTTL
eukprot:364341-Chlamydomonas_euryale.AAC.13